MKKRQRYFINCDIYTNILRIISFIVFLGFSTTITNVLVKLILSTAYSLTENNYELIVFNFMVAANFIWFIYLYFMLNRYVIKNGKLSSFYLIRKIHLNKVVRISYSKDLYIHSVNAKGKEKRIRLLFAGICNNRESYTKLLKDIIVKVNKDTIKIEENAEEIIENIYNNQTKHLIAEDSKPIKNGGWLKIWETIMLLGTIILMGSVIHLTVEYSSHIAQKITLEYLFLKSLRIVILAYAIVNIATLVIAQFKYKWVVDIIVYSYYIKVFIITLAFVWLVYLFGPLFEPNIIKIVLFVLLGFLQGLIPAELARRYFTTSLRVKNTYIKLFKKGIL